MKKTFINSLGLISFLLLISSCDRNLTPQPDSQHLEITVLETNVPSITADVCGTMYGNVLPLTSGIPLKLKIQFKGRENLAQYKIDIHSNFDCHAHERPLSEWSFLKVENLSGKEVIVEEEIPLPIDAYSGNYHCIIRLVDEKGHEAAFVEYNLVVNSSEDDEAPIIAYSLPITDSVALYKGDMITFKGVITDNLSLSNGRLEITYIDAATNDYTAINEPFPGDDISTYNFERDYEIPPYISFGTAIFKLKAYDAYNNSSEQLIKVHILE